MGSVAAGRSEAIRLPTRLPQCFYNRPTPDPRLLGRRNKNSALGTRIPDLWGGMLHQILTRIPTKSMEFIAGQMRSRRMGQIPSIKGILCFVPYGAPRFFAGFQSSRHLFADSLRTILREWVHARTELGRGFSSDLPSRGCGFDVHRGFLEGDGEDWGYPSVEGEDCVRSSLGISRLISLGFSPGGILKVFLDREGSTRSYGTCRLLGVQTVDCLVFLERSHSLWRLHAYNVAGRKAVRRWRDRPGCCRSPEPTCPLGMVFGLAMFAVVAQILSDRGCRHLDWVVVLVVTSIAGLALLFMLFGLKQVPARWTLPVAVVITPVYWVGVGGAAIVVVSPFAGTKSYFSKLQLPFSALLLSLLVTTVAANIGWWLTATQSPALSLQLFFVNGLTDGITW